MPESTLIQQQRDLPGDRHLRSAGHLNDDSPDGRTSIAPITPAGFSSSVADVLPGAVQRIAQTLEPEKIILFGSYAYGNPTPDSDVDLLIIMEITASAKERYLAVSGLLYPRPFPMDILVKTPQEVEHALSTGDFFIKEIVSRGRVLYERSQRSAGVGGAR